MGQIAKEARVSRKSLYKSLDNSIKRATQVSAPSPRSSTHSEAGLSSNPHPPWRDRFPHIVVGRPITKPIKNARWYWHKKRDGNRASAVVRQSTSISLDSYCLLKPSKHRYICKHGLQFDFKPTSGAPFMMSCSLNTKGVSQWQTIQQITQRQTMNCS